MCLHDPRSRPLGDALHSLENCPGSPQFPAPHKSQHHIMRSIETLPPYINQVDRGPPTTCPAPLQLGPPRAAARARSPTARARWSGCPPYNVGCSPTSWGPASSPTVLFPPRPGGTLPHGRTPHPCPITPGRRGVRTQSPPTPLHPPGLSAPGSPRRRSLRLYPSPCAIGLPTLPPRFQSTTPRHSPISFRHTPLPALDRPPHGLLFACHRPASGGWVAPHHRWCWCPLWWSTWSPRRCVRRTPSWKRISTVWSEAV